MLYQSTLFCIWRNQLGLRIIRVLIKVFEVFLNNGRTKKELKVFKRERKAQPGQEGVKLMEKEEENNDVLGSAAWPLFSHWLSQLQARSQLRLAGLYPSAYWCGQALVDVPLFWTLMCLMFGVILLFNPIFPLESWTVPPLVSILYAGKEAARNPPPSFCSEFFALNILIKMGCSRQVFIYPHPSGWMTLTSVSFSRSFVSLVMGCLSSFLST